MQEKSAFHQRKLGISCLDINAGDIYFVCFCMVPLHGFSLVTFPLASNVKAIDDESLYCFSPLLGKLSSPILPHNQISAKQAAVNEISQQKEVEVLHTLWNRKNTHKALREMRWGPQVQIL